MPMQIRSLLERGVLVPWVSDVNSNKMTEPRDILGHKDQDSRGTLASEETSQ